MLKSSDYYFCTLAEIFGLEIEGGHHREVDGPDGRQRAVPHHHVAMTSSFAMQEMGFKVHHRDWCIGIADFCPFVLVPGQGADDGPERAFAPYIVIGLEVVVGVGKFGLGVTKYGVGVRKKKEGKNTEKSRKYRVIQQFG